RLIAEALRTSTTIEQCRARPKKGERLGETRERGETDASGHEPCFMRRMDWYEGPTQWSEHLQAITGAYVVDPRRACADPLVEDADTDQIAVVVADVFEDGEGTAEQRVESVRRLQHDEL